MTVEERLRELEDSVAQLATTVSEAIGDLCKIMKELKLDVEATKFSRDLEERE